MSSYYDKVDGNLHPGDIAKSEDINQIQTNIEDALRNLLDEHHERDSYILGSDEDAFLLLPAPKVFNRYIDTYNVPDESQYVELDLNRYIYRQPITKTKTSLYSIICKMGNKSSINCTVNFELQELDGTVLRKTSLTVPPTDMSEFEVVFDLDYYPTAPGLDSNAIEENEGKNISINNEEQSFDEGVDYEDDLTTNAYTVGASQLYFVAWATDISETDYAENGDEDETFQEGDLYIIAGSNNTYAIDNQDAYVEQNGGSNFEPTATCLYFKDVYATEPTYLCQNMGEAIVGGEKVKCMDTHVSIPGGSEYGNVMSLVYMDKEGHLKVCRSSASESDDTNLEEYLLDDPMPLEHLLIAKILTYSDYDKAPVVIQEDDKQLVLPADRTRPRSHHERIRRLEKQMNYVNDIAIPPRIKYTLSEDSWIDKDPDKEAVKGLIAQDSKKKEPQKTDKDGKKVDREAKDPDSNEEFITTVDHKGNPIIRSTADSYVTKDITLITQRTDKQYALDEINKAVNNSKVEKDKYILDTITESDSKKNIEKYDDTSVFRLNQPSELKNMKWNTIDGTLSLKPISGSVAKTADEAKKTTFNPWDDNAANRPKKKKFLEVKQRRYKVVKGKNGKNDWDSKFFGMTLYVDKTLKLEKLNIPIVKFENCKSVKFVIWRRQKTNNKTNSVWFEKKIYTSKPFTIDKYAKKKGKYQYVTSGFRLNFGKKGLELKQGQYVIMAFPTPKSKEGALFVSTYDPGKSRDFCIVYHGAANGSHFQLQDRFQEIWYNPAPAVGEIWNYATEGQYISGKITFKSGEPISAVKVNFGKKIVPDGCSIELYGDTGNGWKRLNIKDGSTTSLSKGNSFRWKLVMKGNKEKTPYIKYHKKKKYAIQFTLTKSFTATGSDKGKEIEKNLSLTSKPFDGEKILRKYIGDELLEANRFSNFEFARIWAEKQNNQNLLIDINASDRDVEIEPGNQGTLSPIYTLHYCDLTLDDFTQDSVDYSNYDAQIEYDENNMRLKLDTEYSYNDKDIHLFNLDQFEPVENELVQNEEDQDTTDDDQSDDSSETTNDNNQSSDSSETTNNNSQDDDEEDTDKTDDETGKITINLLGNNTTTNTTVSGNQTLLKAQFDNPLNIAQHSHINMELKYNINASTDTTGATTGTNTSSNNTDEDENEDIMTTIKGLALYISSANEAATPSDYSNDPENLEVLKGADVLLDQFTTSDNDLISKYEGKILKVIEQPEDSSQATVTTYYRYVKTYEDDTVVYKKQQLHDIKSYVIYKIPNIKIYKDSNKNTQTIEFGIDQDNINLQYVKEIGLITIGDEKEETNNYQSPSNNVSIDITKFYAVQNDYYPIFRAAAGHCFRVANKNLKFHKNNTSLPIGSKYRTLAHNNLCFRTNSADDTHDGFYDALNNDIEKMIDKKITQSKQEENKNKMKTAVRTIPATMQLAIRRNEITQEEKLCYWNINAELLDYRHIGISLAATCYLPKNMLKINLCAGKNGENVIESFILPSLNYVYYPNISGVHIGLNQIFHKLKNTDKKIKSVSIVATDKFRKYSRAMLGETPQSVINVYIKDIVLYKARTIPIFHKTLRYKFYNKTTNGIRYYNDDEKQQEGFGIRKIGVVCDYK